MFAHYACPPEDRSPSSSPSGNPGPHPCRTCPAGACATGACSTGACSTGDDDCSPACSGPAALLQAAAARLYRDAAHPGGWQRLTLPGGVEVLLHHVAERRWRLAIAHADTFPAAEDVDRCRTAFGVPAGAGEQRLFRYRHGRAPAGPASAGAPGAAPHAGPGAGSRPLHVVELTWRTA